MAKTKAAKAYWGLAGALAMAAAAAGAAGCAARAGERAGETGYGLVSLDAALTGNLAAIGIKPQLQSLYNGATAVPTYVRALGVATEAGQQPDVAGSSNAELWLERSPGAVYGYAYNKPADPSAFGIGNFVDEGVDEAYGDQLPALTGRTDENAADYAKPWLFADGVRNLADSVEAVMDAKDGGNALGASPAAIAGAAAQKLRGKTAALRGEWGIPGGAAVSLWGEAYGPNWVQDETRFAEYGPSTSFPDWLFGADYLNLDPAVPADPQWRLAVRDAGGFNSIGWYAAAGTYSAAAVQSAFQNSSDYVVVAVPDAYLAGDKAAAVRDNFRGMLKADEQQDARILLVPASSFSLGANDLLGVPSAIDALSTAFQGAGAGREGGAADVASLTVFDTGSLKTADREHFDFA